MMELSPDELLTTTRSVRRRLDLKTPVDFAVIAESIEIACQAPCGGDLQSWTWVVIGEPATKLRIAELYRKFYAIYRARWLVGTDASSASRDRMLVSGDHLAASLERVPWLVLPCISGPMGRADTGMSTFGQAITWGSIYPAVWSLQLALRARGLASCLTTNHLAFEREIADLLGIPFESTNQAALIPVARSIGTRFRPAARKPGFAIVRREHWSR